MPSPVLSRHPITPAVLTDAALLRSVTPNALEAGRAYQRHGRVRLTAVAVAAGEVEAQVRGSTPRPYRQQIQFLSRRDGQPVMVSDCTCPVEADCKHVAAVAIALRHVVAGLSPSASPPPGEAPPETPRPGQASPKAARPDQGPPEASPPNPAPPAPDAMPAEVAAWLRTLDAAGTPAKPATRRLVYVLVPGPEPDALDITPCSVLLRKDGTAGKPQAFSLSQVDTAARWADPADRVILRRLALLRQRHGGLAREDDAPDLLRRVIATGRATWAAAAGPPVAEGPARPGRIAWRLQRDGTQRAALAAPDGLAGFRLPAPWYADPTTGLIGPLDFGLSAALVDRVLAAPPIPAAAAAKVAAELERRLPPGAVAPLAELPPPEPLRGPVVPCLHLFKGSLPFDPARRGPPRYGGPTSFEAPLARLTFRYGPLGIPFGAADPPAVIAEDGRLYRLHRDLAGEQAALARLGGIGFAEVGDVAPVYMAYSPQRHDFLLADDQDGTDWFEVMLYEVPALRTAGWQVDVAADFPVRLVQPDGEIAAELREDPGQGSGIDWLELHLGVMVDGQRVDLVPVLLRLIGDGSGAALADDSDDDAPLLLPLPDGRLLTLPRARLRPMLQALMELFQGGGAGSGSLRFSKLDAADLARLEEASGLAWQGGEALRLLGRQLAKAGGAIPPVTVPPSFRGELRPYQAEGVAWLQFLGGAGLGGVLADDMGLGKTVQTLAHFAIEQAEGRLDRPALIVCPTSLVPNWTLEAERFAPTLKLLALHGPARKALFGGIAAHDLVLTTYPLLARDHAVLTAQEWHTVVLDEAQTIKNPNAETTRQALRLRAGQRLCLSGTPLQNHLGELWSLFDFLAPGFLGEARSFRARYRTPIEKYGDPERQALLNRRVRPFLLRRTKDEVAPELPPKTEISEPVEMEAAQRAVYEAIRLAMHAKVQAAIAERGLARSGIIILDALLKMRQACCDPRLLKLTAAKKAGSAKLDRLLELLELLLGEGRRVLVFSQFTSMLALIEARLREAAVDYVLLTGETKDRTTPVRRFQAGEVPVFLISLKAGGVGLNLTAADTVIHYDPWWNPAVEDQATDRAHRIGQDKKVFVHRLVALGTIEEKMETLKDRKRALVASVLDAEHGGALKLTEADVEDLFAPA